MPLHSSLPFSQEKRRHPRLESKIPIKISDGHGDILTETRNLSCSGAFCRVDQRLEVMSRLKIHLLLPFRKNDKVVTRKVTCQGVIVRVQASHDGDYYDTAIFFSDIAPKDSRAIGEFIESMVESKNYGQYN
ncbi:MAG: PilZ domain-containing protein [Candidatus Omnitrophica bacterium]|nr:PilZ domain-containing protein [Candidatus Omnitrophota bacterium]MDE2008977.1 PilZ domain-containing protein [Candidatus Omnitrophota bacterium]MDE2214501.1 PilZ domain-containing protein [Candidatus Omnitrophota bacterium]MDE2230819.1 PilZ domain-containing protein [Candidatus Omnitrophota bacterium]